MSRWRGRVFCLCVVIVPLVCSSVGGQDAAPKTAKEKADDKWLVDRSLTISPRAAPIPALKFRLFPLWSERKEGNAVPIYLRLAHEQGDASRRAWQEGPQKWNEMPIEQMPILEARQFLQTYRRFLQQFELGARRKTAEWNYTLDQGTIIDILLPDVQVMRSYVPMQVLNARVAMFDGNYTEAVRILETGFAFSQHIAQGPFVISGLVGIACASRFADCLLELIERSDSPNLYWALTALPRPLFDLRNGMEFEQRVLDLEFPDLADLDRQRTAEQWDELLRKVRQKIEHISQYNPDAIGKKPRAGTAAGDRAGQSPDLPAAKKYLTDRLGMSDKQVEALPAAQVLLLYLANYTQELRDERFKASYLPFPEAVQYLNASERQLESGTPSEALWLARSLMPGIKNVELAQIRIERKIAALRIIEALRLHAAANGGQLPDQLGQVKIAPIPHDPGTGQPFAYERSGDSATLIGKLADEPLATTGLRYKVTVRK